MQAAISMSFILSVVAYSAASTLYLFRLGGGRGTRARSAHQSAWGGTLSSGLLWLALSLHGLQIVLGSFFTNTCPVVSTRFSLSLAGWVVVFTFMILRRERNLDPLGAFVGPLALTFIVASQFLTAPLPDVEVSRAMLAAHISANLLGLGFVLVAGASSILYLRVERRLKSKSLGSLGRLPSLGALESTSDKLLLLGLPFLTIGAVSGGLFFSQIGLAGLPALLRAVLGYVIWALLAILISMRRIGRLSSRRLAQGTVFAAFLVVVILALYALRSLGGS